MATYCADAQTVCTSLAVVVDCGVGTFIEGGGGAVVATCWSEIKYHKIVFKARNYTFHMSMSSCWHLYGFYLLHVFPEKRRTGQWSTKHVKRFNMTKEQSLNR